MDKEEVIKLATAYLDDFKIPYHWITTPADANYSELFFITTGMTNSPGQFIESTVEFCDYCISARSYYNDSGRKMFITNPERFPALFRLLNFINENIRFIVKSYSNGYEEEPQEAVYSPVLTVDMDYNIKYSLIVDNKLFRQTILKQFRR